MTTEIIALSIILNGSKQLKPLNKIKTSVIKYKNLKSLIAY